MITDGAIRNAVSVSLGYPVPKHFLTPDGLLYFAGFNLRTFAEALAADLGDRSKELGEVADEIMSEWIEWEGGECPVDPGAWVEVQFKNGATCYTDSPELLGWGDLAFHDAEIAAYRLSSVAPGDEVTRLAARIKRLEEALEPSTRVVVMIIRHTSRSAGADCPADQP